MTQTMNPPLQERELDAVELQAHAWVRRIAAGTMTHADGEALRRWCADDRAHAAAFSAARHRWEQLREAGKLIAARSPAESRNRAVSSDRSRHWQRRAFLGAALGATASVAAVAVLHPPLGLWPSMDELRADYRTGTGEQRQVALADDVVVALNTRTSIALRKDRAGVSGIALVAGEAAIDMTDARRIFVVDAGAGRTRAQGARFEVRYVAAGVCVTCLEGRVQVTHAAGVSTLAGKQQLTYDDKTAGAILDIDPARLSAWREGFLRFVDTPLGEVIDEINRYRAGRVVLLDKQMAARPMTGRFKIDALDKAIAQMQYSLGLTVRSLPGGVVLLS